MELNWGVTISSVVGVYSLGWYTYLLLNEVVYEKTIKPPGPQFIPLVFVSGIAFTAWSIFNYVKGSEKKFYSTNVYNSWCYLYGDGYNRNHLYITSTYSDSVIQLNRTPLS